MGGNLLVRRVVLLECAECGTLRTARTDGIQHSSGDHDGGHYFQTEPTHWDRLNADFVLRRIRSGHVLDIGCNTGQLLALLNVRGLDVRGIESNTRAAEYARERGFRVDVGLFDSNYRNDECFDGLLLSHVLEHFDDPLAALKLAGNLARHDGWLFIFVPNVASLRARVRPSSWAPLMPVDHRWHFCPQTLERLVRRAGWTEVRVRSTELNPPSPHRWARPLHRVAQWINLGEQVALTARCIRSRA